MRFTRSPINGSLLQSQEQYNARDSTDRPIRSQLHKKYREWCGKKTVLLSELSSSKEYLQEQMCAQCAVAIGRRRRRCCFIIECFSYLLAHMATTSVGITPTKCSGMRSRTLNDIFFLRTVRAMGWLYLHYNYRFWNVRWNHVGSVIVTHDE